jgi:DNA-binding NtrC family response regulator
VSHRELVLLADDDPLSREFLQEAMQAFGLEVHAVTDGAEAIAALGERSFDLVVTDLKMPHADGMEVLAASKQGEPDRPVVLVTAHGTMHTAVQAMRQGADDILEKPVVLDELELLLERVRGRRRLLRENRFLRAESQGGDMVIASNAMQASSSSCCGWLAARPPCWCAARAAPARNGSPRWCTAAATARWRRS